MGIKEEKDSEAKDSERCVMIDQCHGLTVDARSSHTPSPRVQLLEEVVQVANDDPFEVRDVRVAQQHRDGGKGKGQVEGLDRDQAI